MATPRDVARHKHPTASLDVDCNPITIYVSDPEVMQSGAGWYIGETYWSPEWDGSVGPYDRISSYYDTEAEAVAALAGRKVG